MDKKEIHYKSYKFKILPNEEQKNHIDLCIKWSRFSWNYFLLQKTKQYKEKNKHDGYYENCKSLQILRNSGKFPEMQKVAALALYSSLKNLNQAYIQFFNKESQLPKYQTKRIKGSFKIRKGSKIVVKETGNSYLKIPLLKSLIKIIAHRKIKGEMVNSIVTRSATGQHFVSILTKEEINPIKKTYKSIGLDLGLTHLITDSEGKKYKNNKYSKQFKKIKKKLYNDLSRKQKGSNGYKNQYSKIIKLNQKIRNRRLNYLHKISTEIVKKYDVILMEDLNIKNMLKNKRLSKSILDASWGIFVNMMEYKCKWYGKCLVKVGRFYPSSKTCNSCGWIKEDLTNEKRWTCNRCNTNHDRDINAAINIKKEGLKIYGEGLPITKVERKLDFSNKAYSVKPQTLTSLS